MVGDSVVEEVKRVFIERKVPDYLNRTLIVLIPKIQGPKTIGNYRPISLCNTIYKINSKVIVAQLRPHLEHLVSPYQLAFVPGRRGADNVIIVQELIHSIGIAKGRKGYMAIKIDLEKAYDKIEWSFIREMLIFFNFPAILIKLIMSVSHRFRHPFFLMGAASTLSAHLSPVSLPFYPLYGIFRSFD